VPSFLQKHKTLFWQQSVAVKILASFLVVLLVPIYAIASHIVGGDFTYAYVGDTMIAGVLNQRYKVTLYIYQDCITGVQDAINQDNPAFFTIYENRTVPTVFKIDTSVYFDRDNGGDIKVPSNFSNDCINRAPQLCLMRKRFERIYNLPVSTAGYLVVYQRCCRNASIINVIAPGDEGATYYCVIPPVGTRNSAAVFKNYPPQIICLNNPLYYDHSASDPDGDSLSYEFCPAQVGATDADIKPVTASLPPWDTVGYFPPFSYSNPMSGFPPIEVDPETGIISGTPNKLGRFLVTVCCHEWRDGIKINTTKREFQFVVTDCSKKVVADVPLLSQAPNTYMVNCTDFTVPFINNSSGGFEYTWYFDIEGRTQATSKEFEPTYIYPDTGTYVVKLVVNPGSTCPDSITRFVKIYPVFKAVFEDTGRYCPGLPVSFLDNTFSTMKPITTWQWDFGDGSTSAVQNPVHTFTAGETYNVTLIAENAKGCVDSSLRKIVVQNFKPYAGDDTIIVKGEYVQFDAQGGTTYTWLRRGNLNATDIPNPRANYDDTGTYVYYLRVASDYGCVGMDTVKVTVVDKGYFVMPTAFSPNGDGHNDVFRPLAVGYSKVRAFRVFNRYGQVIYLGNSIEQGWDGQYKGKAAELGVYFWQIDFTDRLGKEGQMSGEVTLVR
jgi:gliding motility-associated-like protein